MEVIEHESAKDLSLEDRKYILAHDDDSGKLYVHIVENFEEYKLSSRLDEVFGHWEDGYFVFSCFLDNDQSAYTTEARYLIFAGHLRNSILVMLKAERKLKKENLNVEIKEVYKSNDPKFDKIIADKNLYDFVYTKDKFVDYRPGFNYKELAKYKK